MKDLIKQTTVSIKPNKLSNYKWYNSNINNNFIVKKDEHKDYTIIEGDYYNYTINREDVEVKITKFIDRVIEPVQTERISPYDSKYDNDPFKKRSRNLIFGENSSNQEALIAMKNEADLKRIYSQYSMKPKECFKPKYDFSNNTDSYGGFIKDNSPRLGFEANKGFIVDKEHAKLVVNSLNNLGGNQFEISEKPTKQSDGKLFYELDWEFIEGMAKKMQLNKQNGKYDRFGWKDRGVDISEMNQALIRHLVAILKGELDDDGLVNGHYYSLACNSMIICNQLNKNK